MTRHDSRAQRLARTWWGPCLAALVGIGSAGEPAAMPLPGEGAQLPGATLIQQSTESPAQPPAGAPGAPSADSFIELHQALTAARERLEELSKAAEAVAATRQQQQELAALRQENQQLRAEIEAAQAERSELETAKQAAEARALELTKTVEQATAQAREMDQQLLAVAARWQNAQLDANRAPTRSSGDQTDADARPVQTALQSQIEKPDGGAGQASGETARLRAQMDASAQRVAAADSARAEAEAQLSEMRASLQRAEQEKASIGADLAKVKGELAIARQQGAAVGQERSQNGQQAGLAAERDELRTRLAAATARLDRSEAAKAQLESEVAELRGTTGPATDLAREDLTETPTLPVEAEGTHLDERAILGGRPAVFALADLPPERRQQVQGLLADLHSNLDERGLMTRVPGELLFPVGSDQVQADAYDTLAKVADLIGMYENRQVLIIGHSDSMGDAERNRQLSKRRADLVKQIFVENFDVPANRLTTEGAGETRPIASNTTSQGRRANRRVEVLILN
jgi:outer membrane protein OmpA-like peptidoglycan-associated protein